MKTYAHESPRRIACVAVSRSVSPCEWTPTCRDGRNILDDSNGINSNRAENRKKI